MEERVRWNWNWISCWDQTIDWKGREKKNNSRLFQQIIQMKYHWREFSGLTRKHNISLDYSAICLDENDLITIRILFFSYLMKSVDVLWEYVQSVDWSTMNIEFIHGKSFDITTTKVLFAIINTMCKYSSNFSVILKNINENLFFVF